MLLVFSKYSRAHVQIKIEVCMFSVSIFLFFGLSIHLPFSMRMNWTSIFLSSTTIERARAIFFTHSRFVFRTERKKIARNCSAFTPPTSREIFFLFVSFFFCRAKLFNCEAHSDGRGERRPSNLCEWVSLERFSFLALPLCRSLCRDSFVT